jgi:hypothetical protein
MALDGAWFGERPAGEDSQIGAVVRIADGFVPYQPESGTPCCGRQLLARFVARRMDPGRAVLDERRNREIDGTIDCQCNAEPRIFDGFLRPRRRGRLGEEEQTVEDDLGDGGLGLLGRVEDTTGMVRTAKSGSCPRRGIVAKRCGEQVVEMPAVFGDDRFRPLDQ